MTTQWEHRTAVVNGINIHYVTQGQGPPVIMQCRARIERRQDARRLIRARHCTNHLLAHEQATTGRSPGSQGPVPGP